MQPRITDGTAVPVSWSILKPMISNKRVQKVYLLGMVRHRQADRPRLIRWPSKVCG